MINLLAPADFFISRIDLDKDAKLKARVLIHLIMISFIFVLIAFLQGIFTGIYTPTQLRVGIAALGLQAAFLCFIKLTGKVEIAGVAYATVAAIFVTLDCIYVSKSLLATGIHTFVTAVVLGFLITNRASYRLYIMLLAMGCSFACYWLLKDKGFSKPYGLEPEAYINQLNAAFFRRNCLLFVSMLLYAKLKSLAFRDLDEEILLRTQEAKIGEVMFLIRSTFPEMRNTLEKLKSETQYFREHKEPRSVETFPVIEESLREMARASRSMTWIYRACRNESVDRTSLEQVQIGIEDLLNRKLLNSPWTISYRSEPTNPSLHGPIPSLMLLHITLVDRLVESRDESLDRRILFETSNEDGGLVFRIRVRSHEKLLEFTDPIRRELIEDLSRVCSAQVSENLSDGDYLIEVRGDWVSH